MKKLYNLLAFIMLSTFVFGQSYVSEDFGDGNMPPNGWTLDGQETQWTNENTNNAAGVAPEARLMYVQGEHTTRLISPVVDLSNASNVYISFTHLLDDYQGAANYSIGLATRTGNGDWNTLWEVTPDANVGPENKFILVDNADANAADFQFCLYLTGNMYEFNYWYIDDIELFTPEATDAVLTSIINFPKYVEIGESVDLSGTILNNGLNPITSLDVAYTVNDGAEQVSSTTTLNLLMGDSFTFIHGTPITFDTEGDHNVVITVKNVNGGADDVPANNTITKTVKAVQTIPAKKVLVEEGTGTWCGWCVRGHVYMDSMAEFHNDIFIGVAVHNGDPMAVEAYDGPLGIAAFPDCKIDRILGGDPAQLEEIVNARVKEISPASIVIKNFSWDSETRIINFDVESEFICSLSDEFRFTAIIVEDAVTGTESGYNQANYYNGGGAGPMGGYEDLPNPVPAADMVYNHVGRKIIGGFDGVEGSLPVSIDANSTHSYTFSDTIDSDWNTDNIILVGAIIDVATGQIVNAIDYHPDIVISVEKVIADTELINVYPNPFKNTINIINPLGKDITVELIDVTGRTIAVETGNASITINTENQKSGVYFIRVKQDNYLQVIKLVK